jgi:Acetyltransferase (GNAT) domain
MLHDWLNRRRIVEWWGGGAQRPTLADVLEDYSPKALADASVTPYVAMLAQEPIGYAESYVALGSGDGWWQHETDPGVRGMERIQESVRAAVDVPSKVEANEDHRRGRPRVESV